MKKELIVELLQKFEEACYLHRDVECWSARELQEILGYSEWRNFLNAVDKAKLTCQKTGLDVSDHFVDVNKMVRLGSGAERNIDDIALTRYACYLIAQNGDPSKSEIAFAQTYFAVQTRKQEIIEQRLLEVDRVSARDKLSKSEKKLSGEKSISTEHVENNRAVRKILNERGVKPEALPPAEDVKKVQRKLEGDKKKLLKDVIKKKK